MRSPQTELLSDICHMLVSSHFDSIPFATGQRSNAWGEGLFHGKRAAAQFALKYYCRHGWRQRRQVARHIRYWINICKHRQNPTPSPTPPTPPAQP